MNRKENKLTLLEQIQDQVRQMSPEKQSEVLDFITFLLQKQKAAEMHPKPRSLRDHPAFGSWRGRNIDALKYQQQLRSEWEERASCFLESKPRWRALKG
jgi:malate synthase